MIKPWNDYDTFLYFMDARYPENAEDEMGGKRRRDVSAADLKAADKAILRKWVDRPELQESMEKQKAWIEKRRMNPELQAKMEKEYGWIKTADDLRLSAQQALEDWPARIAAQNSEIDEQAARFKKGWEEYEKALKEDEGGRISTKWAEGISEAAGNGQRALRTFQILDGDASLSTLVEGERLEVWSGNILAVMVGDIAIAIFDHGRWSSACPFNQEDKA